MSSAPAIHPLSQPLRNPPSPSWISVTSPEEFHTLLSPDWEDEIAHRLKELENGSVNPIPFDDSLRLAYARIADLYTLR